MFIILSILLLISCGVQAEIDSGTLESRLEIDANGEITNASISTGNGGALFSDAFSLNKAKDVISSITSNLLTSISKNGDITGTGNDVESLDVILAAARKMALDVQPKRSIPQLIEHFKNHFDMSTSSVSGAFAHIDFSQLSLAALWYYVEETESIYTPSYKRRVHRYHNKVDINTILELHDALYLMQIAYLPKKELIFEAIKNFRNDTFEVLTAETTGLATEPAHFIMIPTMSKKSTELEVVIAIRGSGDIGDFVSDSLLNATSYRSGKAHEGLARSAKYLVSLYIDKVKELWEVSGRENVKITLVGYSLGAGVASIAAMEFNDYDFIDARAIVFGCPAVLDLKQSEETKSFILSVVNDADIVTRMSGATIANMFLDIMSHDWTDTALLDLELLLDNARNTVLDKEKIMEWANYTLQTKYKPHFSKITKERTSQELYPPGTCIHMFRNGVAYSATYTPCSFFDKVEFSRTLLDDHLLEPGYHPALLSLVREMKGDENFQFPHDLLGLAS